ncbi:hypothetical protein [Catellatospora tritici]|nr:hypothetical protein [Catellatospora tritici]MBV1852774.1 hypothetical protein [Catellatospora tritici]
MANSRKRAVVAASALAVAVSTVGFAGPAQAAFDDGFSVSVPNGRGAQG